MIESIEYTLQVPIEVADGGPGGSGEMVTVNSVTLVHPPQAQMTSVLKVQSLFQRSLASHGDGKELTAEEIEEQKKQQEENKGKTARELFNPNDVMKIFAASKLPGEPLVDANGLVVSMLLAGGCTINGRPISAGAFKKIKAYDSGQIFGEFVANFLLDFLSD